MPASLRVFVFEYHSGSWFDSPDTLMMREGARIRDAVVADLLACGGVAVTCAAVPCAPLPDGSSWASWGSALSVVSPLPGERAREFVTRQADRHDLVWAILPETGGLLASFRAMLGARQWIGCDLDSIRLATSKRATLRHLAAQGVRTPLAFAADPTVTRWVVKPDDGAGAQDTRVHAGRPAAEADLAQRLRARAGVVAGAVEPFVIEPFVVEPWIEGEALSLSLLCDAGRAELLAVNRQVIAVDGAGLISLEGVMVGAGEGDDARLAACEQLVAGVARALPGLRGFVGLDVVDHPVEGPVLIEVNPRATCAYEGHRLFAARRGRPLARDILSLFAPAAGAPERRHA